VTPDFSSMS